MRTTVPYPAYDKTAHCRLPGVDPARFTPTTDRQTHSLSVTKKLCTGGGKVPACPFLEKCLEYGLAHDVHGIWGGLGKNGREKEREARGITPEPLSTGAVIAIASSPEWKRVDSFALITCPDCGREMSPKSVRRHLREKHGRRAA